MIPAILRRAGALALAAAAVLSAAPGHAQGLTVQSVQGSAPALGTVTSAASGDTIFRVRASSGSVTRQSGLGYRVGGGDTRPLVTLACGPDPACATERVTVTVSGLGSSGRARSLDNFTVHPATATLFGTASGTDPMTFTIEPIGQNATRSFYLGMDVAVAGNDSVAPTGPATATFQVSAVFESGGTPDLAMGSATASVFRPISVASAANLSFGTFIRPAAGSATVSLDPVSGDRTLANVVAIGAAAARARFLVSGEGGQAFSVAVPATLAMNGPGGALTVTLATDANGPQALDGALGAAGAAEFHVGGSFQISDAVSPGAYSGVFIVTVQYN